MLTGSSLVGHNGLATACSLARAGKRVLVLECRHVVGECVTEETFSGFKVSTAPYVNSLFHKDIIRELRLHDYGFAVLERKFACRRVRWYFRGRV